MTILLVNDDGYTREGIVCLEEALAGKGHETYQILGTEKRHFDEKEIVSEIFEELQSISPAHDKTAPGA